MTDHELRALMRSDMNAGAKALYEQYARYVYAIIYRVLRDCGTREDVEDCFVETFAEIIHHLESIQSENLKSYIGQAARNRALNYSRTLCRHRRNTIPLEEAPEIAGESMAERAEQKAFQRELLSKIQALGEPDATILVQKYYFGRKMADIAKAVGLSTHAAQVRCGRALKRLRKELEDWR